jgi:hypothetical protein
MYVSKPFTCGGRPGMGDKTTERGRVSRRAAIKAALKTSAYVAPAVASVAYARGVAAATPAPPSVSIVGVCTITPSHYFYNTTVSNFAITGAPPNAQVNVHVEIFYTLGDSAFIDVPVTVDATGAALFTSTVLMIPPNLAPGSIQQVTLRASGQGKEYALVVIPGSEVAFTGATDCLIIPHVPQLTYLGFIPTGQLSGYRFRGTGFPVNTNPGGTPNISYDIVDATTKVIYGPIASLSGLTFFVSVPFIIPGPGNYTFRTFLITTNAFITSVAFTV